MTPVPHRLTLHTIHGTSKSNESKKKVSNNTTRWFIHFYFRKILQNSMWIVVFNSIQLTFLWMNEMDLYADGASLIRIYHIFCFKTKMNHFTFQNCSIEIRQPHTQRTKKKWPFGSMPRLLQHQFAFMWLSSYWNMFLWFVSSKMSRL